MAGTIYRLELSEDFAARLEALARDAGGADVEAFAARLLQEAIDLTEQEQSVAKWDESGRPAGLDDGLPF